MKVHVRAGFETLNDENRADMESLGLSLTNDRRSVRVFAVDDRPNWLAVEFTMPTEAQYKAVGKIDSVLRYYGGNRLDSAIGFPKSEAEQARADRKAERRRAIRREARERRQGTR